MKDVFIDVTPMIMGHNLYSARVFLKEDAKPDEFDSFGNTQSLRSLLIDIGRLMVEKGIEPYDYRIMGEFNPDHLNADDDKAWETPIPQLLKEANEHVHNRKETGL